MLSEGEEGPRRGGLADAICRNADAILREHDLIANGLPPFRELPFPHGRADVVVFGLYKHLYVVPIGVEVKRSIKSATELVSYINQVRDTYEYAFTHIYLAAQEIADEGLAKSYLSPIGYGLLRVGGDGVRVVIAAQPKKVYKSERDYCEVASRGTVMMATLQALREVGFRSEDLNVTPEKCVTSTWVGVRSKINYCGFLFGRYAAFGVYARRSENIKRVLEFLMDRGSLLDSLAAAGYRIHIEPYYRVLGRVVGYVHLFDEPLSADLVQRILSILRSAGELSPFRGWGVGLGVYKRLWDVEFVPTYPTALEKVRGALEELKDFRELVLARVERG